MSKYLTLLTILDELRNEAPVEYKRYYPAESNRDKLNHARSLSYIHLFLKVKFGLIDFLEREKFITDGVNDGGIDGFYIDKENKTLYYIQSKFRESEKGFENVNIQLEELLKMDLHRIVKGEREDEKRINYNEKIFRMMDLIAEIPDIPNWNSKVILLANLNDKHRSKISSLTAFTPEIYNYETTYDELVFPVISGTFYNPKELKITISVNPKSTSNRIVYYADTKVKECNITLLFVPTIEIAKILNKYRNSILKFNPRSFLELGTGSVNRKIHDSITEISTNEFALYNNGITMLSDDAKYSDTTAKKNIAEFLIVNPQIINGGQTAYTLSRIYEERVKSGMSLEAFSNKEVLLKVITLGENGEEKIDEASKLGLIEAISKATNEQTQVDEADRRSNDKIQVQIQQKLFKEYGYFYQRKRGEFADGIRYKYIDRSKIIDRETFLRTCLAINGFPSQARRASAKQIFTKEVFDNTLANATNIDKYFFGYKVYEYLNISQRRFERDVNNKFGQAQYGNAFRYAKFAIVRTVAIMYSSGIVKEKYEESIKIETDHILEKWLSFEEFVTSKPENKAYFRKYTDQETGQEIIEVNFINYYKGTTLTKDLNEFFV
jgi:hypothetical protein